MEMEPDPKRWAELMRDEPAYTPLCDAIIQMCESNERLRAAANAVLWSWDTEHDPSIVDHMEALRELLPPIAPPDGFETE